MGLPFQKTITNKLIEAGVAEIKKNIPKDVNDNELDDTQEAATAFQVIVENCEDSFEAVDLPRMLAGFAKIKEGVDQVLSTVDQKKLAEALPRCMGALKVLSSLALGAFIKIKGALHIAEGEKADDTATA